MGDSCAIGSACEQLARNMISTPQFAIPYSKLHALFPKDFFQWSTILKLTEFIAAWCLDNQ
jgi:hypothetical protein